MAGKCSSDKLEYEGFQALIKDLQSNRREAARRAVIAWVIYGGNFASIREMRQVLKSGIAASVDKKYVEGYHIPEVLKSLGNWHFPDPNISTHASRQELASQMVEGFVRSTEGAIDSASVVFAHSILDDAAAECCRLIGIADPLVLEDQFASRKHNLVYRFLNNIAILLVVR